MSELVSLLADSTWYREVRDHCWTRVPCGAVQLFATLAEAQIAAAPSLPGGTVLYQADWSAGSAGWTAAPGWKVAGGMLLNDGSSGDANQWTLAPVDLGSVTDYAVEAESEFVSGTGTNVCLLCSYSSSFGVVLRAAGNDGYAAGHYYDVSVSYQFWVVRRGNWDGLGGAKPSLSGGGHLYRVEVRGNRIRFLIDGAPVGEATDNTFIRGGRVGLWSNKSQINVRAFRVIKL